MQGPGGIVTSQVHASGSFIVLIASRVGLWAVSKKKELSFVSAYLAYSNRSWSF